MKNAKIMKQSHAHKGYARARNVEILNPLILSYSLEANENKLTNLFSKLRGLKFVKTLVLEFKRYKLMMKQSITFFV